MENRFKPHPIDNSALIHLALHNRNHSNVFRLEAHLRSLVCPSSLQRAADAAALRFPMLAAGIRKQKNTFVVVPCPERLDIRVDQHPLTYMPMDEIRNCALRVLYGEHHIAVEIFHSLTDGAGGLQFLKALLAEYLDISSEPFSLREGWEDSYKKYSVASPTSLPGGTSYLLPSSPPESPITQTTLTFSVKELRTKLPGSHTTLTAFFTALFAQTAMEIQQSERFLNKPLLPVQIMVPIDLRKRFSSASLRNFSLYALPKLLPEAADAPFTEVVENMAAQIRTQSAFSQLCTAITTNVELERKAAALPLWLKDSLLRAGFEVCGGRSSCITVSNLGQIVFPEPALHEIERLDFLLTPRMHSPYNCGIVSIGDTLSLTITRRGADNGVEKCFVSHLLKQGIFPTVIE